MAQSTHGQHRAPTGPPAWCGFPRRPWQWVVTIYFVAAEHIGAIKIGQSMSVPTRIRDLQVACPDTLRLLGLLPAGPAPYREADLHRRFIELWIRGEWFAAEAPLTTFITAHALAPDVYYRRLIGRAAGTFLAANQDVFVAGDDLLGSEWLTPAVRRTTNAQYFRSRMDEHG